MDQMELIVREVLSRLAGSCTGQEKKIPAETSARHVHLSLEDLRALCGQDQLEHAQDISQPGQFLSTLRVRLIGPKGILEHVAVLGPLRKATQVEISATDARLLGINAPVRLSGELSDAAAISLQVGSQIITRRAAIVARRHLHMTPADAAAFGVTHGQEVSVRVLGSRPLVLESCPVRVSDAAALALHMDTDEANAAGAGKGCQCQLLGTCAPWSIPVTGGAQEALITAAPSSVTLLDRLITEQTIRQQHAAGVRALTVTRRQIVTPLARDTARALGMSITDGG